MNGSRRKVDWIFWGGILVGLFVLMAGMVAKGWCGISTADARLILCSGIGILLGTFGSTAVVKYKGVTITGVAAIVIALMYVHTNLTKHQVTFGKISGDVRGAQIEVVGDKTYLGAMGDKSYEFVVRGSALECTVFDVYVTYPPDERGQGERELKFEGIDCKYIERVIGSGKRIEWRFDNTQQSIVEAKTGELIKGAELYTSVLPANSNAGRGAWSFISEAMAQPVQRNIDEIIGDLGSGVPAVRRAARSELAAIGPSAVPRMMIELRERRSVYRIRLGIVSALAEMLNKNRDFAGEVSARLSPADLEIVVEALNDEDRTIRFTAGEFLHQLGDPRAVEPVFALAGNIKGREEIDLMDYVIKGAYRHLSGERREAIEGRLQELMASPDLLRLNAVADPPVVSPGQKSTIIVTVRDAQGRPVPGALVIVEAGGGKFLPSADTGYNPKSRLHEPYSARGGTNEIGEFATWWVCNPCAKEYVLSLTARKEGYLEGKGELIVRIRP